MEEIIFAINTTNGKFFINHIFTEEKRKKIIRQLSIVESDIITLKFNFYKLVEFPTFGYNLYERSVISQQEIKEEKKAFIPITQISCIFFLEFSELEDKDKILLFPYSVDESF